MILWQLFVSYLKIGFFGFGGGYAMLSLIQNEVVLQHQWLTNAEFSDILAISQMTPGPIAINSATYIGYTLAGVPGACVATFSVCLPALTIMVLLTRFFLKLKENPYLENVISAMRPVMVGMIAAAVLMLMFPQDEGMGNFPDWCSWVVFAGCLFGLWKKVNPILLLLLSALFGIGIYGVAGWFV